MKNSQVLRLSDNLSMFRAAMFTKPNWCTEAWGLLRLDDEGVRSSFYQVLNDDFSIQTIKELYALLKDVAVDQ